MNRLFTNFSIIEVIYAQTLVLQKTGRRFSINMISAVSPSRLLKNQWKDVDMLDALRIVV